MSYFICGRVLNTMISLLSLQMEPAKTHLNIKDTWDFHLKENNKALGLPE